MKKRSVSMNKILAIAFVAFIALLIASAFVYARPKQQKDCAQCHGPGEGIYTIPVTATPSKTDLKPGETYTVDIVIGENPSGSEDETGYWIANSDASNTTGTSTDVYGGLNTSHTYTATMTAPSQPGTYYYKVFGEDGHSGSTGATGWDVYSITVTEEDTIAPSVTITYPGDGATLNTGTFTAIWTATDNVGVVNNTVYLNDVYQEETTGNSWGFVGLADGSYSLRIESYDAAGNMGSDTNSFTVSTADIEPPTVIITYPEEGAVLDTGTFTATWTATDNVGVEYSEVYLNEEYQGQTTGYSWEFTDLQNGDYTLMIKSFDLAKNSGDDTNSFSVSAYVPPPNEPPVAVISAPSSALVDETVTFDGTGSNDTDGTIVNYAWDFETDGAIDATGVTVTHAYTTAGSYTVTLTVTDDDGATSSATHTITIEALPPTVKFGELAKRSAWPEHHHFDQSKERKRGEDPINTLYGLAEKDSLSDTEVAVQIVFAAYKNGSWVENFSTTEFTLTYAGQEKILEADFNTSFYGIGKYSITAQIWYDSDCNGTIDKAGETKTFRFAVVS